MTQSILTPPFTNYQLDDIFYDEMFTGVATPRPQYEALYKRLLELSPEVLDQYQQNADNSFLHQGITFTVYGNEKGTERIFPSQAFMQQIIQQLHPIGGTFSQV